MRIGRSVSSAIASHEALTTGLHGVSTGYIAKSSNIDQAIRNADIATGAAIAYAKLNLALLVRNADVKANAAIAESKLSLAQGTQALFDKIAADITTHKDDADAHQTTRTIATGSYTGNATQDRQVTVGFKCSLVFIYGSYSTGTEAPYVFILFPNVSQRSSVIYDLLTQVSLHATDGFTVDDAGNGTANRDTATYYYWAISE